MYQSSIKACYRKDNQPRTCLLQMTFVECSFIYIVPLHVTVVRLLLCELRTINQLNMSLSLEVDFTVKLSWGQGQWDF